ncbi:MAG: intradiol ring-cleavage dioxygenase [Actinomycetota bacterium]|nr:intradiol ring-cleavage dioxygenase [Actinomycetota bacterium]
MNAETIVNRRTFMRGAGAAGAGLVVATRTPVASLFGSADAAAASTCASLTPAKTIGPYFVEEKLNRSDIRTDPATGAATAGVPVVLELALVNEDSGCEPFAGAQVDIWHADPSGKYSDESAEGTSGKKYLRGYQVSDADGKVSFTTVYPGWYSGRTVHIHVRVRTFDSGGTATYDFLTQMFFDDTLTDTVYQQAPYNARGTRNTRNAADSIYGSDGATLLLSVTSDGNGGYVGEFTFGLSAASGSGSSTSTSTSTSTSSSSSTSSDTAVGAALASASCTRTALGVRSVAAKLRTTEQLALDVRLRRGSRTLAQRKVAALGSGTRTVRLPLSKTVRSGRATLQIVASDSAGNRKVLSKIINVPTKTG